MIMIFVNLSRPFLATFNSTVSRLSRYTGLSVFLSKNEAILIEMGQSGTTVFGHRISA
jgi:hypothetical protein